MNLKLFGQQRVRQEVAAGCWSWLKIGSPKVRVTCAQNLRTQNVTISIDIRSDESATNTLVERIASRIQPSAPMPAVKRVLPFSLALSRRAKAPPHGSECRERKNIVLMLLLKYEAKLRELCDERKILKGKLVAAQETETEIGITAIHEKSNIIAGLLDDIKIVMLASDEKVSPGQKRDILTHLIEAVVPRDREGTVVDIIFKDPSKAFQPLGSSSPFASIQMLPESQSAPMLPETTSEG